jgi:uncharacterized membrane protein YkoI
MAGLLLGIGIAAVLLRGPALAAERAAPGCLASGDAFEMVSSRQVVPPAVAIGAARHAAPQAEVLRAALCHEPGALVYLIMALRKDGRLVRVVVDAPSGKVKTVR